MTYHQKSLIAKAVIYVAILILACFIIDKATAKPMYAEFTYKSFTNYKPPRIQQQCWDNFIGAGYLSNKEWICRGLWNDWTEEIMTGVPANH